MNGLRDLDVTTAHDTPRCFTVAVVALVLLHAFCQASHGYSWVVMVRCWRECLGLVVHVAQIISETSLRPASCGASHQATTRVHSPRCVPSTAATGGALDGKYAFTRSCGMLSYHLDKVACFHWSPMSSVLVPYPTRARCSSMLRCFKWWEDPHKLAPLSKATLPSMASQLCWAAAGPGVPDLRGRFAVVTGANRGIGKGVALGLGEAQATVFVTGRKRTDGGFLGKWLAVPISQSNEGEVNLTTIGNWKWLSWLQNYSG